MRHYRSVKKTKDGLAMVNLGCGSLTHWEWNNIDFSPYSNLAHHRHLTRFLHSIHLLSNTRYQSTLKVDPDIIHWDLRKGIPFDDNLFDVVYHKKFITHLYPETVSFITKESYRVLKRNGIIRIVVDDLLDIIHRYNKSTTELEKGKTEYFSEYEKAVNDLFEQMVRKVPVGRSKQKPIVRLIERLVRGDITRTSELVLWHYDKYSLEAMLRDIGFKDVSVMGPHQSRIKGWSNFGLEKNGATHKSKLLFMEGIK